MFRTGKASFDNSEKTIANSNSIENSSQNGSLKGRFNHAISEEKREKRKNTVDKYRAKKRDQKRKRRTKEAELESSLSKSSRDALSEESKTTKTSVSPQKRKGTIWKILFPNKNFDDENCDLERLVCSQVENQISKSPKVIECIRQLEIFEESEEAKSMTKSEFTKQKNRISAQLSRERREAIMHSLINVCINNIKAKKELDADIDEVKEVLKDTLCNSWSSTLKGAECRNQRPSTIHLKAAGSPLNKNKKSNPAITVNRPGTWGLLMSFAVIAWVFGVALMGPEENTGQVSGGVVPTEGYPLRQLKEINLEANTALNYLAPSESKQDKIFNNLIR